MTASNTPTRTSSPPSAASRAPLAVFLVFPALAYAIGAVSMPRPASVKESRTAIDRSALEGEVLLKAPPSPRFVVNADMDGKIKVLGMDVERERVGVGSRLGMTFYYQAQIEMQEAWKVFLHIDSQTAQYRIHGDHFPPSGYSTDKWRKGDIVADRHAQWIPLDAHKGAYDVWLGFYDPAKEDERLKLTPGQQVATDGHNRIKLGTLVVE